MNHANNVLYYFEQGYAEQVYMEIHGQMMVDALRASLYSITTLWQVSKHDMCTNKYSEYKALSNYLNFCCAINRVGRYSLMTGARDLFVIIRPTISREVNAIFFVFHVKTRAWTFIIPSRNNKSIKAIHRFKLLISEVEK
jgi:hypothetical protein